MYGCLIATGAFAQMRVFNMDWQDATKFNAPRYAWIQSTSDGRLKKSSNARTSDPTFAPFLTLTINTPRYQKNVTSPLSESQKK